MYTEELTSRTTWRRPGSSYLRGIHFIDHLAASLDRHRACSVLLIWLLMTFLDCCFGIPVEWLLFSYFTFTIFFNAFSINAAVFIVFFILILTTSGLTYFLVSYQFTNFLASSVVNASLVHGFHGLDAVGWILVSGLSVIKYQVPWLHTLPPTFMAPVAAHCTSFGFLWLLYHMAFFVHSSFEKVGLFFGLVIPKPPVIYIKNIKETGASIYWTLPEKPLIERYLIEINRSIVGESDKQETTVEIMGLSPDTWYEIRVWAVSKSRIRTPSQCIVIKTLSTIASLSSTSVPTVNQSPSTSSVSSSNHSKAKNSTPTKPLATNDKLGSNKIEPSREEDNRGTITEEALAALRHEWNLIRKQRQEITQNGLEISKQSKIEEKKYQTELERLRALKRAEEEPRMKLKSRLKSLDEAKIEADAARMKLERELKLEQNARQHAQEEFHDKEEEKVTLQKSVHAVKHQINQVKDELEKQKVELNEEISRHQSDLLLAESQFEDAIKLKQSVWFKIAEKEEELERTLTENERFGEPDEKLRDQRKLLDQEHRVLFQNYLKLQELERNMKDRLVLLDHEKWTIMQELNKARRLGRLDEIYAGRYRLFGPVVGDSLPEIQHQANNYLPPKNYSNVGGENFSTSIAPPAIFPSISLQSPSPSLFPSFSAGLTSSAAVGERQSTGNSLRNLASSNNSAPDLLTILGSTPVSSTNGPNNYEFDNLARSTPTSKPFRPHHRYQSSHGSAHSLFEYGPVGDIEESAESLVASTKSRANSPESVHQSTSGRSLFSVVRTPSPTGTAVSSTNSRSLKSRKFNLFENSLGNKEASGIGPQVPSRILESVDGGAELMASKKGLGQNLAVRSTSPVSVDSKLRELTPPCRRVPFSSRFEPFSGWAISRKNQNK